MTSSSHTSSPTATSSVGAILVSSAVVVALIAVVILLRPANGYLWLKAAHVISIIAWMAGMLYLPRLFVYHSAAEAGSLQSETFKTMERRLLRAIMTPAMIATWGFGLWLAWEGGFFRSGWLHGKLALVLVLSGLHGYFSAAARAFAEGRNRKSERHWRVMNEVPAVIMVLVVILVIVKPF